MFFRKRPETKHLSDLELIDRYKSSENNFYVGELFKRYTHLVQGVCLKYLKNTEESRDASMAIFEKLLQDLLKHEVMNFKSWLHTVAKNHCLMQLRKKDPEKLRTYLDEIPDLSMEFSLPVHPDEEDLILEKHLDDGLINLNPEQKVCIELFYLQEKCYQEITDITGFSLNQVKSYIQNGKRNLKNYLIEKNAGRKS